MERFNATDLAVFFCNLERACAFTETLLTPPPESLPRLALLGTVPGRYKEALKHLLSVCEVVGLAYAVRLQAERLLHLLDNDSLGNEKDFADLNGRILQLRQLIIDDLSQHHFLFVPPTRSSYWSQDKPLFGDAVEMSFPDSAEDISEAGKCLAVGRATACCGFRKLLPHEFRKFLPV